MVVYVHPIKLKRREKNFMEIIDAHAHIYPEKIAAKATDTIGIFYDIKKRGRTLSHLFNLIYITYLTISVG